MPCRRCLSIEATGFVDSYLALNVGTKADLMRRMVTGNTDIRATRNKLRNLRAMQLATNAADSKQEP